MTPEERNLVVGLFDRLGTLEDARRDPDAERVIKEGLRQAPNAVYSLVQTVLVQDEALKRADARIRDLEEGAGAAPRDSSFLGGMRQELGRGGSVPSVRGAGAPAGVSPAWQAAPAAAQMQPAAQAPAAAQAAPSGFSGGSFLGTAAAAAAGMIGGSLLLSGIRGMMGGSGGGGSGHSMFDQSSGGSGGSPWGGSGGGGGDLARSAGLDDIGRSPSGGAGGVGNRASLFDDGNAGSPDDTGADSFLGDADMDVGGGDD